MTALNVGVAVVWVAFWLYWLISAAGAKRGSRANRVSPRLFIVVLAVLVLRFFRGHSLTVHDLALQAIGAILLVSGLALAVWARIYLGRNWGMPMTTKDEPELVTSGPYSLVRHPIYSGILIAMLGTALTTSIILLVVCAASAVYFIYSARVEEQIMTATFPAVYPGYRARTKMLVPFVF